MCFNQIINHKKNNLIVPSFVLGIAELMFHNYQGVQQLPKRMVHLKVATKSWIGGVMLEVLFMHCKGEGFT